MKTLLVTLAAVLIAACTPKARTASDKDLWAFACRFADVDCSTLVQPQILNYPLYLSDGSFGTVVTMFGQPYLVLDSTLLPQLEPTLRESIIVHEMTHSIDSQTGVDFTTDHCASEARGWRAGNAYLIIKWRNDLVDWDWMSRYGC